MFEWFLITSECEMRPTNWKKMRKSELVVNGKVDAKWLEKDMLAVSLIFS